MKKQESLYKNVVSSTTPRVPLKAVALKAVAPKNVPASAAVLLLDVRGQSSALGLISFAGRNLLKPGTQVTVTPPRRIVLFQFLENENNARLGFQSLICTYIHS